MLERSLLVKSSSLFQWMRQIPGPPDGNWVLSCNLNQRQCHYNTCFCKKQHWKTLETHLRVETYFSRTRWNHYFLSRDSSSSLVIWPQLRFLLATSDGWKIVLLERSSHSPGSDITRIKSRETMTSRRKAYLVSSLERFRKKIGGWVMRIHPRHVSSASIPRSTDSTSK